jgi:hypothetical protein
MKTIETKKILVNFKGEDLKTETGASLTVGETLSNIVISDKVGGKMKCFSLAQRLYNEPLLEVDESDFKLIEETVQRAEIYTNLVTGQLLVILGEIK